MRKKREARRDAVRVSRDLLELAVSSAADDLDLAKGQAQLAREVMLRFNVRFGWSLRRFYCHGCKELLVPGVNARVRLGHGDRMVRTTCLGCGYVNKKALPDEALGRN